MREIGKGQQVAQLLDGYMMMMMMMMINLCTRTSRCLSHSRGTEGLNGNLRDKETWIAVGAFGQSLFKG
jgi:hypothetical protein